MKKKGKKKGEKPMKKEVQKKVRGKLSAKGLITGATVCLMAAVMLLAGCQSADPSSRSNRTDYGGMSIVVNGNNNRVTIDVGDGVTSDASGGGDTNSNTPTQTTDVKPEVAAALAGGSAGTGGSPASSGIAGDALKKLMGIFGGNVENLSAQGAAACPECRDAGCPEN